MGSHGDPVHAQIYRFLRYIEDIEEIEYIEDIEDIDIEDIEDIEIEDIEDIEIEDIEDITLGSKKKECTQWQTQRPRTRLSCFLIPRVVVLFPAICGSVAQKTN